MTHDAFSRQLRRTLRGENIHIAMVDGEGHQFQTPRHFTLTRDNCVLGLVSHVYQGWRGAVVIVKPETVLD